MKFDIFGFFNRVSRPTEILVGIIFILPAVLLLKDIYVNGISEDLAAITLICIPFLTFGIVILLPRKMARDIVIYIITFFMAGLAGFLAGIVTIKNGEPVSYLYFAIGSCCMFLSYRYFRKIRSILRKSDT